MKRILISDYKEIPDKYTGIIEYKFGRIEYWVDGAWHREDGPAIMYDYVHFYFRNGLCHNLNGPAVCYNNQEKYARMGCKDAYYLLGVATTKESLEFFVALIKFRGEYEKYK